MLYHAPTNSLLLKVSDPFAVRELIPRSKLLDHPDYNIAVEQSLETCKVLRNIGINAASPLDTNYKWPGRHRPYPHQRTMTEFQVMNDRCFNLSEPGTMKTNASLWGADYLMEIGKVRKCLILAPLSCLERVWAQDLFETLLHRKCAIVHGSKEKRLQALATDADFYIMNHDGVMLGDIMAVIRKLKIDLVVVDEGSMFRNHNTDKFKALKDYLKKMPRVWWLTGTPTPNAPTDAWAQAQIINPSKVPQFFGQWKRMTMSQVTQFKWVPKPGSNDLAFAALQPAIRFEKKNVIELPPVVMLNRQAQVSREQRRSFNEMINTMKADIVGRHSSHAIDAVNAADKINKLRQILCGAIKVPGSDEEYLQLPHGPRFETLLEAIEAASAKVIIVCPFKGILEILAKELRQHYTVGVLNGDVTIPRRNKTIREFKEGPDPHILLCHPKVMSHGLELTAADTLIFYAPIYSNDEYTQVLERFNRAGQTRKMTITRIAAHPIEWEIYRMVDTRKLTQDNLLSLYRKFIEGSELSHAA